MRLAYYAGASTAAAAACLLKAFHERPNFYSATVYLSQSNACLLILTNLLLVMSCSFMYGLQRLLYGPLRPIEIEQLSEKAWYAVLDTLLAMPSFREDVGGWLLAMFTLLLAGKVWGWIGEGKVDVLEQQPPANPRLFHARLATSLLVSVAFDLWMLDYCVETVMADPRPGMMVIFTFEFAVLSVSSTFTLSRYFLSLIQTRIEKQQMQKAIDERKDEIRAERAAARQNETEGGQPAPADPPNEEAIEVDENEVDVPGWEEKRRYLFALEVFTDFVKLMIYIVFFTVSITFNGLPMHIMRDVYMTFASFSKRVADYVAYRKATSDMNIRYPDATTEEIRGDACIVCRETMVAWEQPDAQPQAQPADQQPGAAPAPARRRDEGLRAKKLPCGHILHLRCLKAWLERQQVCPTCRRPVVVAPEPTAPGQQPVPGANNPAAPRQQPQHPAQRPGRARFFNFGPLRIGFLNGPGDQIGNIIRQLQNPQAAGAGGAIPGQDGAPQAANQQGPNHLGLQVPYANEQQVAQLNGALAQIPTQVRMRQLEQRLMQDAHNLGIEQQQLTTLRAMEGELARLRALHQPAHQGGVNAQNQIHAGFNMPIPGYMPMQPMMPFQQPYIPPTVQQQLHGNGTQQYASGHASLPEGLVLPEGWTAMPLYRADGGVTAPAIIVQNAESDSAHAQTSQPHAVADPTPTDTANSDEQLSTRNGAAGPTDDNGSPLFVPTQPSVSNENLQSADNSSQLARSPSDELVGTRAQDERKAPWASDGWSFVDPPNGQSQGSEENHEQTTAAVPKSANGTAVGDAQHQQNYEGKGKGRAVEVEDAPDEGT